MKNTFQLLLTYKIGNTTGSVDVSQDNCANWDDVTLAYKRSDYDGVIRSFSTSFEFVDNAYDTIIYVANNYGGWEMDGYQSAWSDGDYCRVELRHLQEDWTWPNDADYSCDLDFSTLKITRGKASISAFDLSLTAKIKDMGGDKLKFSAQDADVGNFSYLGIHRYMRWYCKFAALNSANVLTYMVDGSNWEDFQYSRGYGDISYKGVYINSGTGRKPRIAWRRVFGWIGTDTTTYANLQANSPAAEIHYRIVATLSYTYNADIPLRLYGVRNNTTFTLANASVVKSDTDGGKRYVSYEINWYGYWGANETNGVRSSDVFRVQLDSVNGVTDAALVLNNGDEVEYDAEWYITTPSIGQSTGYEIPAFSVSHLLDMIGEKLLGRSMSLTHERAIQVESGNDYIDRCLIFSTGFLHSDLGYFECSYNDVKDWLETMFDYVPTYDEAQDAIVFKPRVGEFDTDVNNAVVFDETEANDVTAQMKSALMYGRVVAGYDKQEYDIAEYSESEYNGSAVTWSTGAASDRELKLVSSWRADTMGIESALDNFDAEDTDSGDIFFVYTTQVTYNWDEQGNSSPYPLPNGTWAIPDTIYSYDDSFILTGVGVNEAATMINRCYNPRMILAAHGFQILPCMQNPYSPTLKFVSTEAANHDIKFGDPDDNEDVAVASDYKMTYAEYTTYPRPMEVTFTASESPQPSNWNYLVEVHADGLIYTGWVTDAKFHILHSKEVQYTIIANSIKQE